MIIPILLSVLVVPLALPLLLAGWHLALWRFADQPPPLFQRERSVSTRGRLLGGLLGAVACYLLCAAAAFAASRTVPSQPSLTLNPIPNCRPRRPASATATWPAASTAGRSRPSPS